MIQTTGSLIERILPKSIHAVTTVGFELKVSWFVLAHRLQVKVFNPLSRPAFGDFVTQMVFESSIIYKRDVVFRRFDRIYIPNVRLFLN
jgi:hypothetical protein